MNYQVQAWSTYHGKWTRIEANSMGHAAALTALADSPAGGHVIVNVASPHVRAHANGAPRVIHRFELAVTRPDPDNLGRRVHRPDFTCSGCGRTEITCSNAPCDAVIADRTKQQD
jgi:hypothetical protein